MSDNRDDNTRDQEPAADAGQEKSERNTRRRFLAGGLATAPVIMTLSSRPAMAARSCTFSGTMSNNLSGPQVTCGSFTPGMWANLPLRLPEWRKAGFLPSMRFDDVFPVPNSADYPPGCGKDCSTSFIVGGQVLGPTLQDALPPNGSRSRVTLSPNCPASLSGHIVAAVLNAGWFAADLDYDFGYSVEQIKTIITNQLMLHTEEANLELKIFLASLNERDHPELQGKY